jgi:hypothetical protein
LFLGAHNFLTFSPIFKFNGLEITSSKVFNLRTNQPINKFCVFLVCNDFGVPFAQPGNGPAEREQPVQPEPLQSPKRRFCEFDRPEYFRALLRVVLSLHQRGGFQFRERSFGNGIGLLAVGRRSIQLIKKSVSIEQIYLHFYQLTQALSKYKILCVVKWNINNWHPLIG